MNDILGASHLHPNLQARYHRQEDVEIEGNLKELLHGQVTIKTSHLAKAISLSGYAKEGL